jgi:hypothetical protein
MDRDLLHDWAGGSPKNSISERIRSGNRSIVGKVR